MARDDGAPSVQVLQQFYVQSTRPTRPGRLTHHFAVELIEVWRRFPVQEITLPVFDSALRIKAQQQLS